jgi:hypothetical protein
MPLKVSWLEDWEKRPDRLDVLGIAHRGDVGTEVPGELDRGRATGGTEDPHLRRVGIDYALSWTSSIKPAARSWANSRSAAMHEACSPQS